MPNNSENIQALRWEMRRKMQERSISPDVLALIGKPEELLPLLEAMIGAPPGEIDLTTDPEYIRTKELLDKDEEKQSHEYLVGVIETHKLFTGDQDILQRLRQGALEPALIARLGVCFRDLIRQQFARMSASGTDPQMMLPRQREQWYDILMQDAYEMFGINPSQTRSERMRTFAEQATRAILHPRKSQAGYVEMLANDLGMDTPTAFFLTGGSVQKIEASAEAMRMSTSSTDTLQRLEGKIPTGAEVESVVTGMSIEVKLLLKDGSIRSLELGVGECMDFFYGNFGELKQNPLAKEPLYRDANGQVKLANQLTAQDRANENLQPVLTYSPFEPKKFLAPENEWSDQPGEKLLTMPDFEFVDRSARDWVCFLAHKARLVSQTTGHVDFSQVRVVDVDVPADYDPAHPAPDMMPKPRRDAAADMKPLFVKWDETQAPRQLIDAHPRVKGLIEELKTKVPPLSDSEVDHAIGEYMLYESVAVRFSEIKKIALALFDVGNETWSFDPAQLKSEVPDPITKALGNIAYLDKYQLFQMDVRQLMLAMYAPVTGQKEGYWPISRALEGKEQHLRFREPLGIGNWPELKAIQFPQETPAEAKTIIKDVFFARRRHRGNMFRDYIRANEIVKGARSGAPLPDVISVVKEERTQRVAEFDQRSPVLIPRSRQDMYAMLMGMSTEQRRAIAGVDFRGYLESTGYDNMNLQAEEYKGWFGLLKAVETHSFKQYDYGETHKLFAKQIKYLTDAGQNFYALMDLAKQLINSLNEQWKKWTGVDAGRLLQGWKPDQLSQTVLKELVDVGTMVAGLRTSGMAQEYFGKVIEAFSKVSDISFQSPTGQREILMSTIEQVDFLIGRFDSRANYETEGGKGEPGTKRKLLQLDFANQQDAMAAKALRAAGYRVVVPGGNFLKPYVTTGDGTPVYSITGEWDARGHRWVPDSTPKEPLSVFRHLGREAALRSVIIMYMQDQGYLTGEDEETILKDLQNRK